MNNKELSIFLHSKEGLKSFLLSALEQRFFYNEAHKNSQLSWYGKKCFNSGDVCPETYGFKFKGRDCLFCFPSLTYKNENGFLISLPKKYRLQDYQNLNFYGEFFEDDENEELFLEDIFGDYLHLKDFPKGTRQKWIEKLEDVYLTFSGEKVYHTV